MPMNVRAEARQRAGLLTLVLESQLLLPAPGSRVNKKIWLLGSVIRFCEIITG